MDALLLSRFQFAAASMFHFLFVPLTLGLALLVAIMETKYVRSGDENYKRMAKFWGKIFLINFAVGVVTGITLEFQFGTNWARYSTYVGDIFGSLLAIEATAAFFLESTFVAVWFFGWKKLSKGLHAFVGWLIFIGANVSAVWILLANGFMQNPVGYTMRNGRAELESFGAVVTNPFAWHQFLHTISASYFLAAAVVMAISAYHLLKKQNVEFFNKSFKIALLLGLISSVFVAGQGHFHGNEVAKTQPAKLAAMESFWDTEANAPMYLFVIPDPENERNSLELLPIPSMLSILAFSDPSHVVQGLKDFPKDERPPVVLTFLSFRIMVGLGTLFIVLMVIGWVKRNKLSETRWFLWTMLFAVPLPYLAIQAGWAVAEVGRQPWIVYNMLKTADATSTVVTAGQVGFTLVLITLLYILLGLAGFGLMIRTAKNGPEALKGI